MNKGERKKAKWAKKREQAKALRQRETEASKPKPKKRIKLEFRELQPRRSQHDVTMAADRSRSIPSHSRGGLGGLGPDNRVECYEDPELARREVRAREEIEKKKKQVAPLYSKGGYQYIGNADPEIIRDLGKKR